MAESAGALTTLLTREVEAHGIEPQAAQHIGNEVAAILNSYDMGHVMNLPHELENLSKQVEMLESQGQVSAGAEQPLQAALTSFASALNKAAPVAQTPDPPPTVPPWKRQGHGKQGAPGKAQPPHH